MTLQKTKRPQPLERPSQPTAGIVLQPVEDMVDQALHQGFKGRAKHIDSPNLDTLPGGGPGWSTGWIAACPPPRSWWGTTPPEDRRVVRGEWSRGSGSRLC